MNGIPLQVTFVISFNYFDVKVKVQVVLMLNQLCTIP
jgi:hypothetical protein